MAMRDPFGDGALPTPYAVALGPSSALDRLLVVGDAAARPPERRSQAVGGGPGDQGDRRRGVVRAVRGTIRH
jgi:hypothetical protein